MKSKRGQVTLFMIVGILIVLIFIAILYVNKISVKSQIFSEETNEVNSIVKLYVNKCLRDTAEPYLQVVGLQGGYLDLSTQETLFTSNDSIAYSLYGDERLLDKDKIEQQISDYVQKHFLVCIDEFKALSEQKIYVTHDESELETTINDYQVLLQLDFPLEIKTLDGEKTHLFVFEESIPIKIGLMLSLIDQTLDR